MTSVSTRFFGQPRLTKPIFKVLVRRKATFRIAESHTRTAIELRHEVGAVLVGPSGGLLRPGPIERRPTRPSHSTRGGRDASCDAGSVNAEHQLLASKVAQRCGERFIGVRSSAAESADSQRL